MKRKNFTRGKRATFQKSVFFKHREPGQIQLWLGDTFKTLLATASENLNVVSVPKYQTLTQTTYDKDILAQHGEEVIVQSIDTVLEEIQAVITSNEKILADGYSTFWYVEYEGRVFCVGCAWDVGGREWRCPAGEMHSHSRWPACGRVALPASL